MTITRSLVFTLFVSLPLQALIAKPAADPNHVIYGVNADTNGQRLHSVPITGGEPVVIGGSYTESENFVISPDKKWVVYEYAAAGPLSDLFVAPIEGGSELALQVPLIINFTPMVASWSPDSERIAFSVSTQIILGTEIWVVNRDGTGMQRVSPALPGPFPHERYVNPRWSSDGRYISWDVQTSHDFAAVAVEVYDTELGINYRLAEDGDRGCCTTFTYKWSPDSLKVAYLTDSAANHMPELYVLDADGSAELKPHGDVTSCYRTFPYEWSPDGSRIAYVITDRCPESEGRELWISTPDGVDRTLVGNVLGTRGPVWGPHWSPDGRYLAFETAADDEGVQHVYVVSADGQSKRSVFATGPGGTLESDPVWSPDSKHVAFLAAVDFVDTPELFVARVDGKGEGAWKINEDLPEGGRVRKLSGDELWWSPNGRSLAYMADQEVLGEFGLYTHSLNGDATRKISGDLPMNYQVAKTMYRWSRDSKRVIFFSGDTEERRLKLHSNKAVGGTPVDLSGSAWSTRNFRY